jgi:hypothetical protein
MNLAHQIGRSILPVVCLAFPLAATATGAAELAPVRNTRAAWTIQIVPRQVGPAIALGSAIQNGPTITPMRKPVAPTDERAAAAPAPPKPGIEPNAAGSAAVRIDSTLYETIYASIPFNRAEYFANPGYRHDATMSLLLGQPYQSLSSGNYRPQALDSVPVDRYFGRVVFGYHPTYLSPYWTWGSWWWRP